MREEGDQPYLEAVEAEFDANKANRDNRKALAAILLAQESLHSKIIDEVGDFIVRELMQDKKNGLVVEKMGLFASLRSDKGQWAIRRKTWPANCGLAIQADAWPDEDVSFGVHAPDPKSEIVKTRNLDSACRARAKLEKLRDAVDGCQKKNPWWPWNRLPDTRRWGPEFAARLVLESPTGLVQDHPDIQEIARFFVQLALAVDQAIDD